jgi:hypothetical protein
MQALLIISCDEVPRDRPTFNYSNLAGNGNGLIPPLPETLPIPTRPDNEVYFKSGHCGCKESKPITLGNCESFCASKNVLEPTLYLEVEVSAAISGRQDIGSFYNWCKKELIDPNTGEAVATNPDCVIYAKDEAGATGQLTITKLSQGSNKLEINISNLDNNKTYRLEIVEVTSGATSQTVQVRKYVTPPVEVIGGPLWTMPVHQYTCMLRGVSPDGIFYDTAQRTHWYFTSETRPEKLENGIVNVYCHDIYQFGTTPINNPLLEETPGAYTLWSNWDPRFYDDPAPEKVNTADLRSRLRINQYLLRRVEEAGFSMAQAPSLFYPFSWPNGPAVTSGNNNNSSNNSGSNDPTNLGWYMTPWIDQTTFRAYCPKQAHYYSNNQLFAAMRDIIGVDTEGLYVAKQEGVTDYILVRESLVKQIWFYIENGQHIEPNNNTIVGKQIQFYWPADTNSPFIRKSHQQLFTIKSATELATGTASTSQQSSNGSSIQYPPHDKRLGCIPSL